ncbi:hypothetical protein AOA12_10780 [Microbacterium sp. No. 7]|nr:hypothetical protein AOA12_10780 [Microbacterium sp. No. 7]
MRYDGRLIGWVQERRLGRAASTFYEGIVRIDGQAISLELSIDFEERCQKVFDAWRDPSSSPHTRRWLRLE